MSAKLFQTLCNQKAREEPRNVARIHTFNQAVLGTKSLVALHGLLSRDGSMSGVLSSSCRHLHTAGDCSWQYLPSVVDILAHTPHLL